MLRRPLVAGRSPVLRRAKSARGATSSVALARVASPDRAPGGARPPAKQTSLPTLAGSIGDERRAHANVVMLSSPAIRHTAPLNSILIGFQDPFAVCKQDLHFFLGHCIRWNGRTMKLIVLLESQEISVRKRRFGRLPFRPLASCLLRRQKEPHVIHNCSTKKTNSVCRVINSTVLDALVSEF